ncbi:ribonuclease H2 subunit A-like isoform X2 [Artemia franciscana]|uniref:ribonuclease H2 subunit A-like isoform X2 n=1 Tax=Artemia franciscana TaxID=6661 RepID=UPI0032DBC98A
MFGLIWRIKEMKGFQQLFDDLQKCNTENCKAYSNVPECCKTSPCALGIDEAGRGPVLGPMVYAASFCPLNHSAELKKIGCADSKTLNEEKRDGLFEKLDENESVGWAVHILTPTFISNQMFKRSKISLNEISHDAAIDLISECINNGANIKEVYVDTVGPPEKYQAKLMAIFPDIKINVSKKADALFPVVSAASICAKVARDGVLKQWIFKESNIEDGIQWGSGYPADPVTKKFLIDVLDPVFGFPQIVRFSWQTAQTIIKDKCVAIQWEKEEETVESTPSVKNFFLKRPAPGTSNGAPKKRHRFFTERSLEFLTCL